jgi:hypothetical protein
MSVIALHVLTWLKLHQLCLAVTACWFIRKVTASSLRLVPSVLSIVCVYVQLHRQLDQRAAGEVFLDYCSCCVKLGKATYNAK